MEKYDYAALYEAVNLKQISIKEGIRIIIVNIFKSPFFFGINRIEKSDFGDFIIFIYPKISNIFQTYDPNKASFVTYIQTIVRMQYKSWQKHQFLEQTTQEYIKEYSCVEITQDNHCVNDIEFQYFNKKVDPKLKITSEAIIILALKASYYLTEKNIKKIAMATSISEEEIWTYKKQADETIKNKIERKNYISMHRNIAYYNLKKYKLQMKLTTDKTSIFYLNTEKAYKYHLKRWKNYLSPMNTRPISVSNDSIAKILGISYSRVRNTLLKLKRNYPDCT